MAVDTTVERSNVQIAAVVVAAAFILVGILGFIPGITTNYDQLEWIGHESDAMLLGLFEVSVFHNVFHLLFGVVGLVLARTIPQARAYLIGGGVIYLILVAYGLVVREEGDANFIPVNNADDWLHLALGLAMIALGALLTRPVDRTYT